MHLFKSQIGRGIRATTDNFRTNNLLFSLRTTSQRAHTLTAQPHGAFAFSLAYFVLFSLPQLCPMKIKHFPIVRPHSVEIERAGVREKERLRDSVSIKIS